jgi:hypothetical protein
LVCLDARLIGQTTKSYVERCNVFRFVSHNGSSAMPTPFTSLVASLDHLVGTTKQRDGK